MAAPLTARAASDSVRARWRVPVAPTLLVAASTVGAILCAAQPHTPLSRVLLGAFATAATAGTGWAWWIGGKRSIGVAGVLAVAFALRLLALPLGPTLSDDAYRYVWDGVIQTDGINPYAYRPTDERLAALRGRIPFEALNSEGYFSVYPPASQLVFRSAAEIAGEGAAWTRVWLVTKLILLAFEALALLLLARLVRGRALLLYAWHPLAVLEIAGQGHTEAAMLPALVLAVVWLDRERPGLPSRVGAGAALAWATMVKLVPLVLAPLALRKGRGEAVIGGLALGVLLAWPYAEPYVLPHVRESLDLYVRYFEFNAGPYFALKELGRWWTGTDVSKTLGPALRWAFVVGLIPLWVGAWRCKWPFARAALAVWAWFFCTTTTVHPWYLLGPLCLVPIVAERGGGRWEWGAWSVLAAGTTWTYVLYAGLDRLYWIAVIAGWTLWTALISIAYSPRGIGWIMERRGRDKWRWVDSHLDSLAPPRRLLDLGAGEGFVGVAAQRATGAHVELCDVTDFNRTDLPHRIYDGDTLPYADGSFDLVLLLFVLHHARDPERVLSEAHRVLESGGQVAVLESVAETAADRRILHVLDPLANRLRSGGSMTDQEEHLAFRSAHDWIEAFERAGFSVETSERRGRVVHKRHLFMLRKRA